MKTRLTIISIVRFLVFAFIATGACFIFPSATALICITAGSLYGVTMCDTIATEINYQKHYKDMGEEAEEFRNSTLFAFYENPICHYIEGKIALRKYKKAHPEVKSIKDVPGLNGDKFEELSDSEKNALTNSSNKSDVVKNVVSNDNEDTDELIK